MCRPAHVSGSGAGLSPCHGLPLPTGWALQITICAMFTRLPIPTRGSRVPPACCSWCWHLTTVSRPVAAPAVCFREPQDSLC